MLIGEEFRVPFVNMISIISMNVLLTEASSCTFAKKESLVFVKKADANTVKIKTTKTKTKDKMVLEDLEHRDILPSFDSFS